MTQACVYCGRDVDVQARETWHLVVGWERPGRAGGSDIALRQRKVPERFACDHCIRKLQRGVSPAQGALL